MEETEVGVDECVGVLGLYRLFFVFCCRGYLLCWEWWDQKLHRQFTLFRCRSILFLCSGYKCLEMYMYVCFDTNINRFLYSYRNLLELDAYIHIAGILTVILTRSYLNLLSWKLYIACPYRLGL